jgi:choline dehydrogenase-like flavoprotein
VVSPAQPPRAPNGDAGPVSPRPTGAAAYTNGTGTFHPQEQRIVRGSDIAGERRVRVDACVIGSGAGGAVVAKELAEGGMRVAILEEGEWHDTDAFTARPREMLRLLYRDAGQVTTLGNPPIVLPLGRAVGGTTIVNSGTCFRTPPHQLRRWREELGLHDMQESELEPFFRRVERILNVSQVPPALAGGNAEVVARGARALGWSADYLYRNVRGCVGSGVCAYGCPSGAKQHVGITYVPAAWEAGATTYTGARAERIEIRAGAARGVSAATQGGGTLHVECHTVIVACGAIHTPVLLRRQAIQNASGRLGRGLAIHPCTGVQAFMDEDVESWRGVPQSLYVDEFASEGFMLEGTAGPPDYVAMAMPGRGPEHRERMLRYRRLSTFGVMVADSSRGEVRSVAGAPRIRYDLDAADTARFKRALERLAELYWAAGAREVMIPIRGLPPLRDGDSTPLREARVRARDLQLMAFHPLGTAAMGSDPRTSVLDPDGRVHGTQGLYVADASAIPGALGVNPQITIMMLATRMAFHLLGRAAPADEPAPERLPALA